MSSKVDLSSSQSVYLENLLLGEGLHMERNVCSNATFNPIEFWSKVAIINLYLMSFESRLIQNSPRF